MFEADVPEADIEQAIKALEEKYNSDDFSIHPVKSGGGYQFLTKPWHPDQLLMAARTGAQLFSLQRDHDRLAREIKQLAHTVDHRVAERRAAVKRGFGFDKIVRAAGSPMDAVCEEVSAGGVCPDGSDTADCV